MTGPSRSPCRDLRVPAIRALRTPSDKAGAMISLTPLAQLHDRQYWWRPRQIGRRDARSDRPGEETIIIA